LRRIRLGVQTTRGEHRRFETTDMEACTRGLIGALKAVFGPTHRQMFLIHASVIPLIPMTVMHRSSSKGFKVPTKDNVKKKIR